MKELGIIFFTALFIACALMAAETPIALSFSFENGGTTIEGKLVQKRRIPGMNLKCRVTASDKEQPQSANNNILLGEWNLPKNEPLVFHKETSDLPERRRYICKAVIINASGKELCSATSELATPPNPANWRGFKEGIPTGEVPSPWTAVRLKGNAVSVWGRTFLFKDCPLPSQIVSKNVELLASPAKFQLDPAPSEWKLLSSRKIDDTTVRMEWTGKLAGKKAYNVTTEIYFDGVMRLEFGIPEGVTVNRYAQIYPIRKEVART
ncbi:MAG: hypothetical protein IJS08_11550, partial [Victivallales bacterium]|nr:hypothetical protein [Victivallales bacterium]